MPVDSSAPVGVRGRRGDRVEDGVREIEGGGAVRRHAVLSLPLHPPLRTPSPPQAMLPSLSRTQGSVVSV